MNGEPRPTGRDLGGSVPPWSVAVVIPARNEAATIDTCIEAALAALDGCGGADHTVVVVADRCGDDTAERARRRLGHHGVVLECDDANVGRARHRGARLALDQWPGARRDRIWLATTDADSIVPAEWLQSQLRRADEGYAAVAGVVRVDSFDGLAPHVAARWAAAYAVAADGTHLHIHGANLGVRADAYEDVGGWPLVATAEDHALWTRLQAGGWATVSTIDAGVTTSGRRHGRAPLGFAHHLRALEAAP